MVKNKIICHVKTESENALVQNFLFHNRFKWSGNIPYFPIIDMYHSETCLFVTDGEINLSYGSLQYVKKEKYEVLGIPEFFEEMQNYLEGRR